MGASLNVRHVHVPLSLRMHGDPSRLRSLCPSRFSVTTLNRGQWVTNERRLHELTLFRDERALREVTVYTALRRRTQPATRADTPRGVCGARRFHPAASVLHRVRSPRAQSSLFDYWSTGPTTDRRAHSLVHGDASPGTDLRRSRASAASRGPIDAGTTSALTRLDCQTSHNPAPTRCVVCSSIHSRKELAMDMEDGAQVWWLGMFRVSARMVREELCVEFSWLARKASTRVHVPTAGRSDLQQTGCLCHCRRERHLTLSNSK
jgi:hypothetical protein